MRLAVIGGGIAGLVAAYLLAPEHEVVLFEANDYLGGHTHTVPITVGEQTYPVDTGFIVFNLETYPNFVRLLRRLGVKWQPTNMSFSVQDRGRGLEFGFRHLGSLVADLRNLGKPELWRLLWDIWRFRRRSPELQRDAGYRVTIRQYLAEQGFSPGFAERFLLPLASALWSADPGAIGDFPARYLAEFFARHRFLNLRRKIRWQVIQGGSQQYVNRLTQGWRAQVRLRTPVQWIRRPAAGVEVKPQGGEVERFDQVILATHSDQALKLLADPSEREREILGAFPYQENLTLLHTDPAVMPRRQAVWASWNYLLPATPVARATLTYHLNRLQSLKAPVDFLVSLNLAEAVEPARVLRRLVYHHPVYRPQAPVVQQRWAEINGTHRTYFCGAYWGYGFHEDGVVSALQVARAFGRSL